MSLSDFLDRSRPAIDAAAGEAMKSVSGILSRVAEDLKNRWATRCREQGREATLAEFDLIEASVNRALFNLAVEPLSELVELSLRDRGSYVV